MELSICIALLCRTRHPFQSLPFIPLDGTSLIVKATDGILRVGITGGSG